MATLCMHPARARRTPRTSLLFYVSLLMRDAFVIFFVCFQHMRAAKLFFFFFLLAFFAPLRKKRDSGPSLQPPGILCMSGTGGH